MSRHDEVYTAINRVVDPCSNAMGLPLGLSEMGLAWITDIEDAAGMVHVTTCVTSPCCAYAAAMALAVEEEVLSLDWVRAVKVSIDTTVTWTEAALSPQARDALAARRTRTVALSGAQPYAWNARTE